MGPYLDNMTKQFKAQSCFVVLFGSHIWCDANAAACTSSFCSPCFHVISLNCYDKSGKQGQG